MLRLSPPRTRRNVAQDYEGIMIDETVSKLELQLREATNLSPERKAELLRLLGALKAEVAELSKTNREDAQSIARFTEVSALEATRLEQNPKLRELSLEGLKSSVEGFEQSHPRLVQAVNSISQTLSNLGI
jgi:hypothetical protein